MFIATIVAAEPLTEQSLLRPLENAGCRAQDAAEVEPGRVWRIRLDGDPVAARATLESLEADIFVRAADAPMPKLLIADMDSTMITIECIDELADYAAVKPQVAAITEQAMRGELDFAGSLRARVKLLAGLGEEVLARCYDERLRIMPGAKALVRTLCKFGATSVLVSGGFSYFADRVASEIGFDHAHANRLCAPGGQLDGMVAEPILGPAEKEAALRRYARGLDMAKTLTIGDGANDIPMLQRAGFGIAFHGKPAVVAAGDAAVRYGDLTAVLHCLGVPRADWVD